MTLARRPRISRVMLHLKINGNQGSPRLAKHLLDKSRTEEELKERIMIVEKIRGRMQQEGVPEKSLNSYGMVFEDEASATDARKKMADSFSELGIRKRAASAMADGIVMNASELGEVAFVWTIFAMAKTAIEEGIPSFVVKDIIDGNLSNGIPALFSRICVDLTKQTMSLEITEEKLLERFARSLSKI